MPELPVFIKRGDARSEVDDVLKQSGLSPDEAGFRKYLYVTQANQTVVMVDSRDSVLARALRARGGWLEPVEGRS